MIIVSAPSGAGKTTIVKELLQAKFKLEFSVSATSRPKRTHEIHGKDYHFIDVNEFQNKISNQDFVEWEQVYENRYYGTLKSEVERIWSKGNNVIFDVDVQGGINIKKLYKEKALSIFIKPPSIEELKSRLQNRSTDSQKDSDVRIEKAESEMTFTKDFDIVIINDILENAVADTKKIVSKFLLK